jgi:O-methyltransferase
MSTDVDRILRDNDRLTKHVRDLEAQLNAVESSRWWRLNPRQALRRLRAPVETGDAQPQAEARFPVDFDDTDIELCRRVAPYTMTTPPRIYALVRAVEYVCARNIPGALVECGVWRGGSMMAVALTLLRLGAADRELYLFDTFSGMTPPTEIDVKPSGERAADLLAYGERDSETWAVAPLDEVCEAVLGTGYPAERIHFVEGPVEATLPANAPVEIALLRLDTDWYGSTKHELVHLYPRVSRAGVLILDDYGFRIDHTARLALKP